MHLYAEKLFYTLSAMLLGAAFFVLQPAHNQDTRMFQSSVLQQFKIAAAELWGDEPVLDNANTVVAGINQFYSDSADAMIALLSPAESEKDMYAIAGSVYHDFAMALSKPSKTQTIAAQKAPEEFAVPENFMQEPAVANIIPETNQAQQSSGAQTIASANLASETLAANDLGNPWVNLRDNSTGQVYCVAIYNAEVNRYLGPCKNDLH